jgi:SAM-dependent methyltransferase
MNPPPNFNRLAALYRWMEMISFGLWLSRCRCAFLSEMAASRHALVLGDGDGRFTSRLLAENPTVQIDAVDASPAMLRALIHRAGPHAGRVRTHVADARQLHLAQLSQNPPCDLIVTHFFLDCLTTGEVQSLASNLRGAVSADALWVVSEFSIPTTRFGRLIARPLVACLYLAFGWLTGLSVRTLPDHRSALNAAGFTLKECRNWLGGLLVSELWSAEAAQPPPP